MREESDVQETEDLTLSGRVARLEQIVAGPEEKKSEGSWLGKQIKRQIGAEGIGRPAGTIDDFAARVDGIANRVGAMAERAEALADRVYGPGPAEQADCEGEPRGSTSALPPAVDRAFYALSRLDRNLNRLETAQDRLASIA